MLIKQKANVYECDHVKMFNTCIKNQQRFSQRFLRTILYLRTKLALYIVYSTV